MQEFFDSIPQDQWKLEDPAFIKQSEEFAITSKVFDILFTEVPGREYRC
jgi:hypothetical protein